MPSTRRSKFSVGVILAVTALVILGLVLPQQSAAQSKPSVRDKFRTGDTVMIAAGETVPHDLYLAGGTVRVDGRIDGDLFVAGGTIDVTGPVAGDLFVGGGTVRVSGPVTGGVFIGGGTVEVLGTVGRHVRVAGGQVTVGGAVQRDILAGAGVVTLLPGAKVGGDLIFSVGEMHLGGAVAGGVLGSAETYTKTGSVTGAEDVTINVPRATSVEAPAPATGSWALDFLRRYVTVVVIGALLLWLPPRLVQTGAAKLRERPLPSLGFGALGFVGFFATLLGLFIAMVALAIPLGILGLGGLVATVVLGVLLGSGVLSYLFFVVLAYVATAVVGLLLGQLALERVSPSATSPYVALLAGVLAIVVVTAIPVAGGLVAVVVALLGLGALILRLWPRREAATPAGAASAGLGSG